MHYWSLLCLSPSLLIDPPLLKTVIYLYRFLYGVLHVVLTECLQYEFNLTETSSLSWNYLLYSFSCAGLSNKAKTSSMTRILMFISKIGNTGRLPS